MLEIYFTTICNSGIFFFAYVESYFSELYHYFIHFVLLLGILNYIRSQYFVVTVSVDRLSVLSYFQINERVDM